MTIIVFYPVNNPFDWGRDEFPCLDDDLAFKKFWEGREDLGAVFYNMSTRSYSDRFGQLGFLNAADFETDYNDELYDGGFWVQVLIVDREFVKEVVSYGEQ